MLRSVPRLSIIGLLSAFLVFMSAHTGDFGVSASETEQRTYQVSLEESPGLSTAVFRTPQGTVRVNLPDDAAPGDTLSGTVYLAPSGRNERERQRNRAQLTKFTIDVANTQSSASDRIVKFELAEALEDDSFKVILRNPSGRNLAQLAITAAEAPTEPPGDFDLPRRGQAGRWINVHGPFDGDLENTILTVGGTGANPLAESPRKSVFQSPESVVGITELRLAEGFTEIVQAFRNVAVSLSAGKLNLIRGETTIVTVTVAGLAGIEDSVPLQLSCDGSADMQGGNNQNLQISPNDVNPDGSFVTNKTLIGNQIGNFNVTATVPGDRQALSLTDQPVHIERDPVNIGDENDKVWWMKVKTLDGQIKDIYVRQDFKPNLKVCDWIKIDNTEKDESLDWVYVTGFQKVEDPTAPCELKDKTVKVEGDPIGPINGGWQIRVTGPDGKAVYIYVKSQTRPAVKKGQWIRIRDCKKLSSNSYAVDGYDVVDDPNKPPPAPTRPTPTPTPKPTPVTPPSPVVRPCEEGSTRKRRTVRKTFEVMTGESEVIFKIYPDKDSGSAADNMAAWLNGTKPIRDYVGDNLPEGTGAGGAAAGAALQYVDTAADIITALAKSKLRNLAVSEVTAEIFVTTKKVVAVCTTYEVCVSGRWVKKTEYRETVTDSSYRNSKSVFKGGIGWEKVSVTSRPQSFDPDKAEAWGKEFLKSELEKLKRQGDEYKAFKEGCK